MSVLLRLLGLDANTAVHSVLDYYFNAARPLSSAALYLLIGVGLALALVNFLPFIKMRTSIRVWTFLLRVGMVGALLVVALQLELHLRLRVLERRHWVAVVDDSGSMSTRDAGGKSRFEAAISEVERVRDVVGDGVNLEVKSLSGAELGDAAGVGPTYIAGGIERAALNNAGVDRLLLLTDGRDTKRRDFTQLGGDIQGRGINLGVRLIGSTAPPPNLGIFAEPERSVVRLGEELVIRGSIFGEHAESEYVVYLKKNGEHFDPPVQKRIASEDRNHFVFTHTPQKSGSFTYTLELAVEEELSLSNTYNFRVEVVEEPIRLLMIEGYPRYEFKLYKTVLEVDPLVHFASIVHMPGGGLYAQGEPLHSNPEEGLITSQAELFQYDVVILRDVPRRLFRAGGDTSESRLRNIVEFVTRRGGGLVVTGGRDVFRAGGYEDTSLAQILPFDLSAHFGGEPQFEGMFFANIPQGAYGHPILRLFPDDPDKSRRRLNQLRELDGTNNVGRFKPLATPLMTRFVEGGDEGDGGAQREVPLMAYQSVGEGSVVGIAADTLWRWQLQPDFAEPPLETLLANIVRYVAPAPRQRAGSPYSRVVDGSPQVGQDVVLTTTLRDRNYEPIRGADLEVTVERPDGREMRLYPRDLPEQPGVYQYRVPVEAPGLHHVVARHGREEFETSFVSEAAVGEFGDLSVDGEAMEVLTAEAGGRLIGSIDQWLEEVSAEPATGVADRTLQVWNSPMVVLVFLLLLGTDCFIRKRQGLA